MPYSLKKLNTSRYVGDSGPMSVFIPHDGEKWGKEESPGRPKVGGVIRVGSPYTRTYQSQDWWQTSLITEILEDRPNYVRFKTLNSEYEWTHF